MPRLKKVVLAIGNTLIYKDTYEQALGELSALIAKEVELKNPEENLGAQMVREAAERTGDAVGDARLRQPCWRPARALSISGVV